MLLSKSSNHSQRSILLGTILIERIAPYLALVLTKIEFRRHTRASKRGPAFSISYGSHCNRPHCFAGSSHVVGGLHDWGPIFRFYGLVDPRDHILGTNGSLLRSQDLATLFTQFLE